MFVLASVCMGLQHGRVFYFLRELVSFSSFLSLSLSPLILCGMRLLLLVLDYPLMLLFHLDSQVAAVIRSRSIDMVVALYNMNRVSMPAEA